MSDNQNLKDSITKSLDPRVPYKAQSSENIAVLYQRMEELEKSVHHMMTMIDGIHVLIANLMAPPPHRD